MRSPTVRGAGLKRIETRISERSPLSDISGGNIKCHLIGTIDAVGPVRHNEILVRVDVPRPEGITAFHQVSQDKGSSWLEIVGAITALCGVIEINREPHGRPG